MFTVTCLEKNGSVGWDFFFFFLLFFFFFFTTQTTEMHILAVIMLHQHKFCVYKGKRKLKLLITCEIFVLLALEQFLFCFVNIFFWKCGKKVYSRGGFREGRSGYSKHNFFFFFALLWGARWLSGRVSDSGARGPGFETYRRRVVSLSKTLYSPKVLVNYPGSDGSVPIWLKNCWLGR